MKKQIVDALEICLQAMENGEGLDSVLSRYPHLEKELRPLLESAQAARSLRRDDIPANAAARGRVRVLSSAAQLRQARAAGFSRMRTWRFAVAILAVGIFLSLSGGGLLSASARSLPGDALYPLKRSVEKTQLTLISDPFKKRDLEDEFQKRRLEETESLMAVHRTEQVEFEGVVTARIEGGWQVAGIPVMVTPSTRIDGTIGVGMNVQVIGETQTGGSVRAIRIRPEDELESGSGQDGSATPTDGPGGTEESGQQKTEEPEPTESHGGGGDHTPEPTGSQGGGQEATRTPEPTGSHEGSGDGKTKTPEPTKTDESGHG